MYTKKERKNRHQCKEISKSQKNKIYRFKYIYTHTHTHTHRHACLAYSCKEYQNLTSPSFLNRTSHLACIRLRLDIGYYTIMGVLRSVMISRLVVQIYCNWNVSSASTECLIIQAPTRLNLVNNYILIWVLCAVIVNKLDCLTNFIEFESH